MTCQVSRTFQQEMGKTIGEVFSQFNMIPISAASMAQVHKAKLMDGTDVAVKVTSHVKLSRIKYNICVHDRVVEMIVDEHTIDTI